MPMTPGLVPTIRENTPEPTIPDSDNVIIEIDEGEDKPLENEDGKILQIEHPDGSLTISLDGKSLFEEEERGEAWFDNLAEKIPESELNRISYDLLTGIEEDKKSRQDWIEERTTGLKLLGIKIEVPGIAGGSSDAPVDGMSTFRHPLLLEAVLRFAANARSEMLPTDGPVKVRNDNNDVTLEQDRLATALERDMNHFLTAVATEYYPDTDRMLFMLGLGGTAFKKVYFCPLRNRPVSETVDANDLIVNNSATDLRNATRITHRVMLRPSTVKRLQLLGVYRDLDLSTPISPELDSVQREKESITGVTSETMRADDRDREIYECYCELNIDGYEHKYRGKVTGLEVPYRVTIDVSSKQILSIVRNYEDDENNLPCARDVFVKYTYIPGVGFYDLGLLHILGNTTNAITAASRELLDAGMYAVFPGFLMSDTGARQNTNIFRIPPGGGALVKTGGMPINQAIMPLPYKEPSQTLMALVENIAQTGSRLGGTSEQMVGEGRADAPVGTTLAQIEQAQKVLNAIHKRLHSSQAEEFRLLKQCFKENPESFWQRIKKPAEPWDEQRFLTALEDYDLVPQADPNTASHVQRVMKVTALKQLQAASPSLYDPIAVDTAALQAIGWSNPTQFLAPPQAQSNPPPELIKMQSDAMVNDKHAEAALMDAKTRAHSAQARAQNDAMKLQLQDRKDQQTAALDAQKVQTDMAKDGMEAQERARQQQFRERIQMIDLAQNIAVHPTSVDEVERVLRGPGLVPPRRP